MKLLLFISILAISAPSLNIDELRSIYFSGMKNQSETDQFFNLFQNEKELKTPELKAYYGAAHTLKAKFARAPIDKKAFFTKGAQFIEDAIKEAPKNFEVRLIRLSVQENSPAVVKYKSNIDEDKAFILKEYDSQNKVLKLCAQSYIQESKVFTEAEKTKVLK